LKSREQFVKEVAKSIRENHSKQDDESFIFGISGKWGEGKTTFLKSLEKELKNEFKIVWVNPWKFATDKVSFLRNFTKSLLLEIFGAEEKKSIWNSNIQSIWKAIKSRATLSKFYFDESRNKIHLGWFSGIILFLAASFLVWYFLLPQNFRNVIIEFKWLLTIIAIPIFLSIAGKMISTQRSSRAVSTLDEFEHFLRKNIIEKLGDRKILIFVDDLDRVAPHTAREVLDNLRTFFDKKELTFVVTGDHTVLERYLGENLLPHSEEPEQLEEGRRFLKKIFNVYWRLPLPIDKELKEFLTKVFDDNSTSLSRIFEKDADKEKFKEYLGKKEYFENNFRQILRFLETTIFTFNIISNQKDNTESENKKYFEEMAQKPLLVIRVLMIQELCAPLFDKIIEEPNILYELEHAVDTQDTEKVKQIISQYESEFSSSQKIFIEKFLYEKPRFCENRILSVLDIRPFLYLAADASFGDARGPVTPEDFVSILEKDSPKELKQSLTASGETKSKEAGNEFIKKVQETTDAGQKSKHIKTMLKSLVDIPDDHKAQNVFLEKLKELDIGFYTDLPPQERMESYIFFWQWLDKFQMNLTTDYKEKFNFVNHEDFNFLQDGKSFGNFASYILSKWFVAYYNQNNTDALTKFQNILPRLKKPIVNNCLSEITEKLADEIITDQNEDSRGKRFDILINYTKEGKSILRKKVFSKIEELDNNIWQFAISKIDIENAVWNRKELERKIMDRLEKISDINGLLEVLRFGQDKIQILLKGFRKIIFDKHFELFVDNLAHIVNEQNFQYIAPDSEQAEKLFYKILEIAKDVDDNQKIQWLDYLDKSKWPWSNLEKIDKRKFSGLKKTDNQQVKDAVDRVLNSWTN